jgi:hypothetical protein
MHGYFGFAVGCIYLMSVVENKYIAACLGGLAVFSMVVGYFQN